MNSKLPDIAALDLPAHASSLDWVGMDNIDLPVVIEESGFRREHHARIDAHVNLPAPNIKGIHMSRLHLIVDELEGQEALSPKRISSELEAMIDSHTDCESTGARLRISLDLLLRRGALESPDIGGWKSYPVVLEAVRNESGCTITAEVSVTYSSTCPCSAALSRQLIERQFSEDFQASDTVSIEQVSAWLLEKGTLATPHGQRSTARIRVSVSEEATDFGLVALVDRVEHALATPVQTAVKRIDEQAFAYRNGQNLMFVEDAARLIHEALASDYRGVSIDVIHMESLHAHDAVASTSSGL